MIWTHRLTGVVALISAFALVGTAFAAHQHHDGKQFLGNKINTNGTHHLHKVGDHTVSVQVTNKKIAGVTVAHRTKGSLPVIKYRTSKKMVEGTELNFETAATRTGSLAQPANYMVAQSGDLVWIGYAFSDGVNEYIYWFPAEMIVDPYTGAVEYIPV